MGTRSLTHIYDEEDNALVTIYRQYDGYPSIHGAALVEFMRDRAIVNGFNGNTPEKASNGMGCFAASLIASLKDGIGNVYVDRPGASDRGEEYTYHIYFNQAKLSLSVLNYDRHVIFNGTVAAWDEQYAQEGGIDG